MFGSLAGISTFFASLNVRLTHAIASGTFWSALGALGTLLAAGIAAYAARATLLTVREMRAARMQVARPTLLQTVLTNAVSFCYDPGQQTNLVVEAHDPYGELKRLTGEEANKQRLAVSLENLSQNIAYDCKAMFSIYSRLERQRPAHFRDHVSLPSYEVGTLQTGPRLPDWVSNPPGSVGQEVGTLKPGSSAEVDIPLEVLAEALLYLMSHGRQQLIVDRFVSNTFIKTDVRYWTSQGEEVTSSTYIAVRFYEMLGLPGEPSTPVHNPWSKLYHYVELAKPVTSLDAGVDVRPAFTMERAIRAGLS